MRSLNNKGVALITALILIIVMSIIGAVFFASSVHEKTFTEIEMKGLSARYWADAGLVCISSELRNQAQEWVTHDVDPSTFALIAKSPDQVLPLYLSSYCQINANGEYVRDENADGSPEFAIKVYMDPTVDTQTERIILIQAGNTTKRLFAAKVSSRDLYEFFTFTPYDYSMGWSIWDANGGKMYSGGNFIFQDAAIINDVSEMITPNYVTYDRLTFVPEGTWTRPSDGRVFVWNDVYWYYRVPYIGTLTPNAGTHYTDASGNTIYAEYYNVTHGRMMGDNAHTGLLMVNPEDSDEHIPWNGCSTYNSESCNVIFPDYGHGSWSRPEVYDAYDTSPPRYSWEVLINDIYLPNRIDGAVWQWNRYYDVTTRYGYPEELIQTTHLNSQMQADYFASFLEDLGLDEVIKENSTGGEAITPLTINAGGFEDDAQTNGMYIEKNEDGEVLGVRINGVLHEFDEDNEIILEGRTNPVLKKRTFWNTGSARRRNTVQLDVGEMIQAGVSPNNGIVYSENDLVVSNAPALPAGGLSIVSEENLFIHAYRDENYNYGCFNCDSATWQPAAAVASELIYLLSSDFTFPNADDPPATLLNPNSPEVTGAPETAWQETYGDGCQLGDACMPNRVLEDQKYYISMVGYWTDRPYSLERWDQKRREIYGSFVRLEEDNFPWEGYPNPYWPTVDRTKIRCCGSHNEQGYYFPAGACRDCSLYGERYPNNMFTNSPTRYSAYELRYHPEGEEAELPPGGLIGLTASVWIEIAPTEENFNQHYEPLSSGTGPESET